MANQSKPQNENINQSKPENAGVGRESMRVAFNFKGCNKLEQNSLNNIVAMKVNAAFKLIVPEVVQLAPTRRESTTLDTFRFYQKFYKVAM